MLLAAVLAGITGLISAWALRRGFAVVASIVVLIVVAGVVRIVQEISDFEDIRTVGEVAGLFSPWTLHNGLAEAWNAGGTAVIELERSLADRLPRHGARRLGRLSSPCSYAAS